MGKVVSIWRYCGEIKNFNSLYYRICSMLQFLWFDIISKENKLSLLKNNFTGGPSKTISFSKKHNSSNNKNKQYSPWTKNIFKRNKNEKHKMKIHNIKINAFFFSYFFLWCVIENDFEIIYWESTQMWNYHENHKFMEYHMIWAILVNFNLLFKCNSIEIPINVWIKFWQISKMVSKAQTLEKWCAISLFTSM